MAEHDGARDDARGMHDSLGDRVQDEARAGDRVHDGVGGVDDDRGLHGDDAGGDHGVHAQTIDNNLDDEQDAVRDQVHEGSDAGEDDDERGRSSSYKTSQENKRERGRCLEAQNLMMVQSNLVLFLATVIFDEEMMFQIQGLCNTEGEMAYLSMQTSESSFT